MFVVRGEFLWRKLSDIEAVMAWNRGIPWKKLKITHNYLIFIYFYHFLLHFLIISSSTELIFDYIEIFWVRGEVFLRKVSAVEADMAWKRGIPLQNFKNHLEQPNIFILFSFFFTFSSFQGAYSLYLIMWRFLRKRWISLRKV